MPGAKYYPRVLVIDPTPFNRTRNVGILKSNLFQGWPKSQLAQIDYSNIKPGFDVCDQYWRLRKVDIVRGLFGPAPGATLPSTGKLPVISDVTDEFAYDDRASIERRLSILRPSIAYPDW